MSERESEFSFSPSLCHRRVMDETHPALAYDGGDVGAWQVRLRERVRALLGLDGMRPAPLNARTLWAREAPRGRIEKVVFTSEAGADVPAYLCLPHEGRAPYPVFICLQGHTTGMHNSIAVDARDETRPITVEGDRDFAVSCMEQGYAALAIEQRAFGERSERHQERRSDHGCHDAAMRALMLGRTLAGERVFDVERAIDYLETRRDLPLDLARLATIGTSGGGTVLMYAAAVLPRLRLAVPICSFCTYRDSIMSIYHCADNYVPGLYTWADMPDVMGAFAPKPTVVVAGETDPIFPIAGVREAYGRLEAIYRAAHADGHCHLVVGPEGHRHYADLAWPVIRDELDRMAGEAG